MIASGTSIEIALELAKLYQGICKGCRDVGSRFAAQPLGFPALLSQASQALVT
jgi:hypothetical protein